MRHAASMPRSISQARPATASSSPSATSPRGTARRWRPTGSSSSVRRGGHRGAAGPRRRARDRCRARARAERPSEALEALAEEHDARAIVVGSYGESPLRSAILGSTPHKLLHEARRPVLVVPVPREHERGGHWETLAALPLRVEPTSSPTTIASTERSPGPRPSSTCMATGRRASARTWSTTSSTRSPTATPARRWTSPAPRLSASSASCRRARPVPARGARHGGLAQLPPLGLRERRARSRAAAVRADPPRGPRPRSEAAQLRLLDPPLGLRQRGGLLDRGDHASGSPSTRCSGSSSTRRTTGRPS